MKTFEDFIIKSTGTMVCQLAQLQAVNAQLQETNVQLQAASAQAGEQTTALFGLLAQCVKSGQLDTSTTAAVMANPTFSSWYHQAEPAAAA